MHRREFVKRAGMALAALALSGSTVFLTACGHVAQDIVVAFQSVLKILRAAGVITNSPAIVAVSAALDAVLGAVTAYANAPAADKTSFGLELATVIHIAEAQLQTFYNSLNLTGPLGAVIESLIAIILSTITGFLPQLPTPMLEIDVVKKSQSLARRVTYQPHKRESKEFRAAFNKALTDHGYAKAF